MKRLQNLLIVSLIVPALAACGGETDYTIMPTLTDTMEIGDTTADRLTPEQYKTVVNSFNSAATAEAMIWPSRFAGDAEATSLLTRALNTRALPREFVSSHGPSPVALNAVFSVYKKNIARGYNEDMQRAYFVSKWGGRETRAIYVGKLVSLCPSSTEADKVRAGDIWDGKNVGLFVCSGNTSYSEYRLPGRG